MRIENSFIPIHGVGEKTERDLWRSGITHWDEFDPGAVGEKTGQRIEAFIVEAREHLDDGDAAFFGERFPNGSLWRVYENFRDDAAFFDIETTGLDQQRSVVTTVSVHRGGETRTLVRDENLTREALEAELADASVLVSYNGRTFDAPFLTSEFDISLDAPHVDLRYLCNRLDLSGGLKGAEAELGIGRDGMDVDGREAIRLWRRYENGDDAALDRLVRYNRYDAENLQTLLERVHTMLHDDVFASHASDAAAD